MAGELATWRWVDFDVEPDHAHRLVAALPDDVRHVHLSRPRRDGDRDEVPALGAVARLRILLEDLAGGHIGIGLAHGQRADGGRCVGITATG